jgi:hypothetical protein
MMPMAQKTVADEAGLQHQVCKAHVLRNTDTLIERYQPLVAKDADGSLAAIGVSPQQAAADLERLEHRSSKCAVVRLMSQSRGRDTTGTNVVKAQPNLSPKGSGGQQQG